jgi:hypothetical protein
MLAQCRASVGGSRNGTVLACIPALPIDYGGPGQKSWDYGLTVLILLLQSLKPPVTPVSPRSL